MKVIVLLILFASCGLTKQNERNNNTDENSVVSLAFNIRKEKQDAKSVIELIKQIQSPGTIKNQNENVSYSGNYLSIYTYKNKKLTDSMTIEHPLYKHLEYVGANNAFAVKDTVVTKEEFFIRLQIQGRSNEIKIFETLKNKPKREELISLKL